MTRENKAAWFFGGAGIALTLSAWLHTERRRSRAEREDPHGTIALATEVNELLEEVILKVDEKSEAAFHEALGRFLEEELASDVEWEPLTPQGRPDLLIDDRVALELKYDPKKTEIDRCVGQLHGFAEEWLTFLVVFATPPSRARYLRDRLDRAGLEHVPLVEFK